MSRDGRLSRGVVAAKPDVFNHNLETVPGLYLKIRPGARYFHSLRLLQRVKEIDPTMFTKSGIMVGLGEGREEVLQLMDDLRSADVDFLTIGQYLQPTRKHAEVKNFITPDEFKSYERMALAKGLLRRGGGAVAEVAEKVGYSSASAFSVAFARHVGMAPARYAREVSASA